MDEKIKYQISLPQLILLSKLENNNLYFTDDTLNKLMQNGELGTFLQGSLNAQKITQGSRMQGITEKISEDINEDDEILYEAEQETRQIIRTNNS